MAQIIAIANHKGGVGKTTTTACVGVALSRMGKRVLLVDLDAQANLTSFFINEDIEACIYDALTNKAPLPIHRVSEFLSVVPASLELARAEIDLSTRIARERILATLLQPHSEEYDFILLDCPPSLGIITTNALVASSELYIPLTAEALPLKGLKMLEDIVSEVQSSINPTLKVGGVIITRYNNRKLNKVVFDAIEAKYSDAVFSTKIRENISIAETPLYGGNIFEYAPDSNGAKDYEALAQEIANR